MKLVLLMYNAHPYFFPQKFGQKSAHYTWQNTVNHQENQNTHNTKSYYLKGEFCL